jgi:hypothetical protein
VTRPTGQPAPLIAICRLISGGSPCFGETKNAVETTDSPDGHGWSWMAARDFAFHPIPFARSELEFAINVVGGWVFSLRR